MSIEERMHRVEKKVKTVEDAIILLTELTVNHGEMLSDSLQSRENLDVKISALIDAQIRSEDKLQNINSALEQLTRLVEKAHTRIDRLEN